MLRVPKPESKNSSHYHIVESTHRTLSCQRFAFLSDAAVFTSGCQELAPDAIGYSTAINACAIGTPAFRVRASSIEGMLGQAAAATTATTTTAAAAAAAPGPTKTRSLCHLPECHSCSCPPPPHAPAATGSKMSTVSSAILLNSHIISMCSTMSRQSHVVVYCNNMVE